MIEPNVFKPFTDGFYETGNQVHDWVMRHAQQYIAAEDERKHAITNAAEFEVRRAQTRQRYLESIGGLPDERSPLNIQQTGHLKRDGYTIGKLIYQSLPGFYVTGNLYMPDSATATAPGPGVLMACGHAKEGKAAPKYQQVCNSLVRAGFIVLIIDAPSNGEMVQVIDRATGEPLVGLNTTEHRYLQLTASIVGHNIMRYFIWNAVRGIDLLGDLSEVDPQRIGVTGNSGGGHLTQAMLLADPRVAAAVSCCSLTTRKHYLANGVRAYDGEQNYFGCICAGLDYDDFLAAFAPKPLCIGAAAHDFYAIEGVLETVNRTRRVYRLFDAEDNLKLCVAEHEGHGYTDPLRRACVTWFAQHLQGRSYHEELGKSSVETPADLQCTQSGQVLCEFDDARSILDLNRDTWQATCRGATRTPPSRETLRRQLNLPATLETPIHVRCTSKEVTPQATSERIFYFSEPDVIVTAVVYRPASEPPLTGATMLLVPNGTVGQSPHLAQIADWLAAGRMVMVFDPRGIGAVEMRHRNHETGLAFCSTEFRVANDHFMLGTSIAARRTFDVLGALAWLRAHQSLQPNTQIELTGHGWIAIYGLLAAAVDGHVDNTLFTGLPKALDEVFTHDASNPDHFCEPMITPELCGEYDIPDLLRLAEAGNR